MRTKSLSKPDARIWRPALPTRKQKKHDMLVTFIAHAKRPKKQAAATNPLRTFLSLFV